MLKLHAHPVRGCRSNTLAASQDIADSCSLLGRILRQAQCGLKESIILAKHYAGKNLGDACSIYNFSFSSYFLEQERYEGILNIAGHSPIPKFLFWGRKAVKGNLPVGMNDHLTKCISISEDQIKSDCANCRKEEGCSSFIRCSRCLGAWYCGKECQVQHWKAGHKIDCIKSKK